MSRDKNGPLKRLAPTFRALSHRNYRLFFGGQSISLIGTWMQQIALGWLVYRLTGSAFILGLVGFAGRIPTLFITPLAGVMIDRKNRYRILIATQVLSMVQASILATLVLAQRITVPEIIILSLILGLINSFDIPARQSFVVDMIGRREDLGNAIALNSSIVNSARLIGPTLAGILVALVGEGYCFLINAVSFLAVIASLLAMKISPPNIRSSHPSVLSGLKEGFTYAFGFPPIRSLLLLLALISLMGMPYMVLMPVFAKDILHGGPHTFGFLMGAAGVGALAGTLYLASRKSVIGLGRIIVITSAVFGTGLIAFSLSRHFVVSVIFLVPVGFGMMVQMASINTVLQTIVDEDKRGRVMSLYTMAIMGMVPLGSLLAGGTADVIGVPSTIMIGGACCLLGSFLFARKLPSLRKLIRPIYVKKGVIPGSLPE